MVTRVVPLVDLAVGTAAGDNPPLPAVAQPGRFHGVLLVVAELLFGKDALVVAKAPVVELGVGVGACLLYTSPSPRDRG